MGLGTVFAADIAQGWQEVIKWEGRMDELVAKLSDEDCCTMLVSFSNAHSWGWHATGSRCHARSIVGLEERRVELLGKMGRFRDQGEAMCCLAHMLTHLTLGKEEEVFMWYQKARDVGAAHGFFSVESKACQGLGYLAWEQGRREEGLDLLRNAMEAARLSENEDINRDEFVAMDALIDALFKSDLIDEVEPLVDRYRELAKAESAKMGRLSSEELASLRYKAQLHEVPCIHTPSAKPLRTARPISTSTYSVCHRFHRARVMTHALLEPSALSRHVGSLKMQ
jgi:hypothetical protein